MPGSACLVPVLQIHAAVVICLLLCVHMRVCICGPGGKNSGRFLPEMLVTCAAGLVKGNRVAIQPMLTVCILESVIQSHSSSYISKLWIRYSHLLRLCALLYGLHSPGTSDSSEKSRYLLKSISQTECLLFR